MFEESLADIAPLSEAAPGDAQAQRDLLVGHYKLGTVAQASGDLAQARARYQHAFGVGQRFERPNFFVAELAILGKCLAELPEDPGKTPYHI
ncbi:MAG: hypothetical protein ACKODX_19190 [Gemmata sp.]